MDYWRQGEETEPRTRGDTLPNSRPPNQARSAWATPWEAKTPPLRAPAEAHLPNRIANVAQALKKGKRAAAPNGHEEAGQGEGKDTRRGEGKDPRQQPPRSPTDPKRAARLPRGTRVLEADEKNGQSTE